MRSKLLVLVAVLAAVTAGAAQAGTTFIVTGHGWGHGVGMSQWGAYGYARHGWTYQRILAHYYPGTKLEKQGEPKVRVLLREGAGVVTVGCAAKIRVTNGRHHTWHLPAKTYGISAHLAIPVPHKAGKRPFARGAALFSCAKPLTLDGRPYRGTILVRRDGSTLDVVNRLKLDQYVRGVVPSESPARWPLAELEAQAVAARSYALAKLNPASRYDVVPDTRDQVYGGMTPQTPKSNKAVAKTKGEVLTFDGTVVRTYYSSSSGGRTEALKDAWPGAASVSYLPSVPDPYDSYSPNHDWGPFPYSSDRLGSLLGVGSVESVEIDRNSSLRAATVRLRLASGQTENLSGETVERTLGLKSTWFSIGALSLSASAPHVVYGGSVNIDAQAVDAKGAVLQELRADGVWHTLQHVHGTLTRSFEPQASTAFRLRMPGVSGDVVSVAVRPQLRVQALGRHVLGGQVLPRGAGPVLVYRVVHGTWRIVARPHVTSDGSFRTPLRLRPTVYRVTAGEGSFAPVLRRLVVKRSMLADMSR